MDIGYIVLSKNRIFDSDTRKWMRKLEEEKTLPTFILVFTEAH